VDESVLEATQDWEFEPPMKDGNLDFPRFSRHFLGYN